jgi:glycosyltransferase involved in cell wall biosynthesis
VVDDASTDSTSEICSKYDVTMVQLKKNQGPAYARNTGAHKSNGDIIIFLDSDVTFPSDIFDMMLLKMKQEPSLAGVGSVSSPEPLNSGFYSRYFALHEYHNVTAFSDQNGYYVKYICTRCGTIKKNIFEELGGFNEKYKIPSMEDYQFSLRLPHRYRFYWHKGLMNQHHFPDSLSKICKRYHRNTKEMYQILRENKSKDADLYLLDDARVRLLIGIAGIAFLMGWWLPWSAIVAFALLLIAAILKKSFLKLLYQHEGFLFAFFGWVVYLITTIPIATGMWAGMSLSFPRIHGK